MMCNYRCLIFLFVLCTNRAELCEEYIVEEGTQIESMNYPGIYPSNVKQCWTLRASSVNETINIRFVEFQTESFDPVHIYDGSSSNDTLIISLSGSFIYEGYTVQSTGQYMRVTFTSDSTVEYTGFEACACITSAAPCSCPSDGMSVYTIITIAVAVPIITLFVLAVVIRLSLQFCGNKSTHHRVHPTSNQIQASRRQVRPNQQQMPPPYSQYVTPFGRQPHLRRGQPPPPGQQLAQGGPPPPPGGQPPPPGQQPAPGGQPPPPGQQLAPGGQPTPPGQQLAQGVPPGGQLPPLMGYYPPPTEPPPPYGPPQPQANLYPLYPVQQNGPTFDNPGLHQQQVSSSTASAPPAPEGLYRNTSNREPPPAPTKVT